jgi:hypothetical protein
MLRQCALLLAVLIDLCASFAYADDKAASALRLIPFPKEFHLEVGKFAMARPLLLTASANQGSTLVVLIETELRRAGCAEPRVQLNRASEPVLRLSAAAASSEPLARSFRDKATEEDYCLRISPDAVDVAGRGAQGLIYGVQTVCQLIRANRDHAQLPCLRIRDWPSLRWRGFQNDMTRGPSAKLETLEGQLELGAFFKMNFFTYYMEYQFAFKKHPDIGPPAGSLQPEELVALVQYGKPLGMNIAGGQQSFGHWGAILKNPRYAPLAETPTVLTPVKEETYQLLDDLYSEVCPLVPFPMFNVNCDEVTTNRWHKGLGEGPSKELAAKIGVGGVYAQHVRRLHDLLQQKYGKRMMMWADIALHYPQNLKDIPKDIIMLPWVYRVYDKYDVQITPLTKAGFEVIVCPGVSDWLWILPDFSVATGNIRNFVRDGARLGAIGMLNTEWKDGSVLNGPNWYEYAWGAECAWNASATDPDDFNRRIGSLLFGEKGDRFGRAIGRLSAVHKLPGMNGMLISRFWEQDFVGQTHPEQTRAQCEKLLEIVRPVIEDFQQCQTDATVNARLLDVLIFGARRMELLGTRQLDGQDACRLYQEATKAAPREAVPLLERIEALVRRNRDAHAALATRLSEIWLAECKPYALDAELTRYRRTVAWYEGLLKRVDVARAQAVAGQPLPSAKDVGWR